MKKSLLIVFALLAICVSNIRAAQTDLFGPAGSERFGLTTIILPNGNIVVSDPYYDAPGGIADVGAVYLYDGATLALISTLNGSAVNDRVGDRIVVLTNGNYVVASPNWNDNRGAITFCNALTGITGTISSDNSLVGSTADDLVGGITPLPNGNYVVTSRDWDNGATANAGAVTFGNGTTGISGTISADNSLIGSTTDDQVGSFGITALPNGNYVVSSSYWDSGAITDVGAVTWGNGAIGVTGVISASNSLVGSKLNDQVGYRVTVLTNGNYVVRSPNWDSVRGTNAGAVTWGNGATGTVGKVSISNSLVGSKANDQVGNTVVTALTNGNYVVSSPNWDNGIVKDVGAVTWGNGATGISGTISIGNSLVGSTAREQIGGGVTALTNGNYVVNSPSWGSNDGVIGVGAVTWGDGMTGITGTISSDNSLTGSVVGNQVGSFGTVALSNGNYVVRSPLWDNGTTVDVGAATFGNGTTGITGVVSANNSLVGLAAGNVVGNSRVVALTNGNYVVISTGWDNGAVLNVGAVTWGNGTTGITGTVSAANSLIGSTANDNIGSYGITALTNGNYVVSSPFWRNGATTTAGAVTFGNGTTGISGTISAGNSLVGSMAGDQVGLSGVTALTNGNYVVSSRNWDNGAADVGAATFGNGTTGISGTISASNSLIGSTAGDQVSNRRVTALPNGNYVVESGIWDNGVINSAGAITYGNGVNGTVGTVTDGATGGNSIVGTTNNGASFFGFDAMRNRLIGRSALNVVSILSFTTPSTADGGLITKIPKTDDF